MNFVYISPQFPKTNWEFCDRLKKNGVNILGIADIEYDQLDQKLKDSLTEYYKVSSLENYDEVLKAVAFFTHKYGKIDWLESNNEYWLVQDSRLRSDFNITTGIKVYESIFDLQYALENFVLGFDKALYSIRDQDCSNYLRHRAVSPWYETNTILGLGYRVNSKHFKSTVVLFGYDILKDKEDV